MLLCLFVPGVGAADAYGNDNFTPDAYVGLGFGVHRSNVNATKVIELSFTDHFLHAVRLMATAQDAQAEAIPPDAAGDSDDIDMDDHFDLDHDNLHALQDYPGDQNWWLFRPDPDATGRQEVLNLRVTATTTMDEIERQLIQTWPDLRPGRADWDIMTTYYAAFDAQSHPVNDGGTAFLVRAQADLGEGVFQRSVVLLSLRTWNLRNGHASTSSLRAFVLDSHGILSDLFTNVDFQGRCDLSPCPVEHNGQIISPWRHGRPFVLVDGDFLQLHAVNDVNDILPVTGAQTGQGVPNFEELPGHFQQLTLQTMQNREMEPDEVIMMACKFQQSLTSWARDIYSFTNMHEVDNAQLAIFLPESDDVVFLRFLWRCRLDVFRLYYDITQYMLDDEEQDWSFVHIKHAASLHLDAQAQHLGIRLASHVSLFEQDALCLIEVRIHQDARGTSAFSEAEFKSRFLPLQLDEPNFYAMIHLDELCAIEECVLTVDGQYVSHGERIHVEEGSFLQVFVGDDEPSEAEPSSTICVLDEQAGVRQVFASHIASDQPSLEHSDDFVRGMEIEAGFSHTRQRLTRIWNTLATLWYLWGHRFQVHAFHQQVLRLGEAEHPGPDLWIGTSNPSGLRGKEESYFELPVGIWGISENHLTHLNQRDADSTTRRLSHEYDRHLHLVHGAPVGPRTASSQAGTWAGVSTITDLPCRSLSIPWPNSEHALGRAQMLQLWFGPFQMEGANVYGWPRSPTWPRAAEATETMLQHITQELVLSRTGPRFIVGDFNCKSHESPSMTLWKTQGWVEVQEWAFHKYGRPYTLTSKNTNILDYVFLSPELAQYLTRVDAWTLFADHTTIGACLDLPVRQVEQQVWQMPAYIPYDKVDMKLWHKTATSSMHNPALSPDEAFRAFSLAFEDSFGGAIDAPGATLPPSCRGRGQRCAPEKRPPQCPILKPSRPGEVQQSSCFLGRTVHKWFMQLRRMQSMLHALKAGKTTWDAIIYRTELWRAIRKAKGFEGGFVRWWQQRPIQCQGSPMVIPTRVPSLRHMELLFLDYEINYRKFEHWHARQRKDALQLALQENQNKIFALVRPTGKTPLQHLEARTETHILGISDDGTQIHVEEVPSITEQCVVNIEGQHLSVVAVDGPVLTLSDAIDTEHPEVAQINQHFSTVEQIQGHLAEFWRKRWWKSPPSESDWQRIFQFGEAYLQPRQEQHEVLTVGQWKEANKRYKQSAARGPDGYARRDLQWMPEVFQENLVQQMNHWESVGEFPAALCTGFVHPLPKRDDSVQVGDFRPVIIYSMIYRSWASLRAKQILEMLSQCAGHHQFGFLQNKEGAEIWMLIQATIEESILTQKPLAGYVSDIEKAFEGLPRKPLLWLGQRLGASRKVLRLWDYFLTHMSRRFSLSNEVGPPIFSNSGFPEGCAMSCAAMAIANVVFHKYMDLYARVTSLSFVDNLELLSRSPANLHDGILKMQAWSDMWALKLDAKKSYAWASTPSLRAQCKQINVEVKMHAKDLGAPMTYGSKHSVAEQLDRIKALKPLWLLLRRMTVSIWMKQKILIQAFWPRAYYGSAICCMSWTHTKQLRTEAMRALKVSRGGASPGMRLAILCQPQTDPGYFHFWQVLLTFKRICRKQPGFVQLWGAFMHSYQGAPSYGPFGKLLEICAQVGWQIAPPFLVDHDGVAFNLLLIGQKRLEDLAIDAWRQGVAAAFGTRKDVPDLQGIAWRVLDKVHQTLPPFKREAIHVLQDGTFVERRIHSKYDLTKDGSCIKCGQEDTILHRCRLCPATCGVREQFPALMQNWDLLPQALSLRLLPSRNPFEMQYKQKLMQAEAKCIGLKTLSPKAQLDLFTDGSCMDSLYPWGSAAAWSVVSASHDKVVAKGTVAGWQQTSDRAEVIAIKEAAKYATLNPGHTTIWSDNAYAAGGVARLLNNIEDAPNDAHADVWEEIQALLHGHDERIQVQHVSSHRRAERLLMDVDSWTAYWNDRADHEAVQAHALRSFELEGLRKQMLDHFHWQTATLKQLVDFHFMIAETFHAKESETAEDYDMEQVGEADEGLNGPRLCSHNVPWQRALPDLPGDDLGTMRMIGKFGYVFTKDMFDWLRGETLVEDAVTFKVSLIELAIHLGLGKVNTRLPMPDLKEKNRWVDPQILPAAIVGKQTVAAILKLLRIFFLSLDECFDFEIQWVECLDLTTVGVTPP